jgi:hypothetical protein
VTVEHRVFSNRRLLEIPVKRAAWADRTALLMAEMSKLAYYRFELDPAGNVMPQADLDQVLERLLAPGDEVTAGADAEEADELPALPEGAVRLKDDLAEAGFELAGLFSHKRTDTQAFLAISTSGSGVRPFGDEQVAVLSFRGTKTVKDWLNNVKFLQKKVEGAAVHWGFQGAFDAVEPAIRKKLDPLLEAGRTLYLTGHSLGGALALIAAREIAPESHGACYTFGSPRLGRFGFARNIKTPIYRVVNANDLVPRVPPAYLPSILLIALYILNVPAFGLLRGLIGKITRYVHYGDMRFLRRTKSPTYHDLQVLSNTSVIYRFFWYWPALLSNWRSPIKNHDINLYCAKLSAYAESRNSPSVGH